jgi:hypothetical protein
MSKRRRGQKTLVEKELLGPLVQMWYRRTTLINPTIKEEEEQAREPHKD